MYLISEVEISNFWNRLNAKCRFNPDVNIIIGRNGTGKTTFMNILHAALSVDIDEMANSEFEKIKIILQKGRQTKTIKVRKLTIADSPFQYVEYQVSTRKYMIRSLSADDRRIGPMLRKRALEESAELRQELSKLVSLSSLSVYRLRSGEDYEIKDRSGRRLVSPVDFRLSQIKGELTQYQFELSQAARIISANLQKDVLASILFKNDVRSKKVSFPKKYEKDQEQAKLVSAYSRLGAADSAIRKQISAHSSAIEQAVNRLHHGGLEETDIAALEAFLRTQHIIEMSLKAEEEINEIFSQINLFISILKDFIPEKTFSLEAGRLVVTNIDKEVIPTDKLSSGEKQLLILLIEALLQKSKPYVYLADEPELSLHIEWQRKILPAVKKINPHAQIIAATHSPEVASKYKGLLIDMKDVANA